MLGAEGAARHVRRIRTDDRRSRSGVEALAVAVAALPGAHPGSPDYSEGRLRRSFALRPLPSHRDASPFPPAWPDNTLDALCGSACRLRSSDTARPLPAAFPPAPAEHTAGNTGCRSRTSGRSPLPDDIVRSCKSGNRSPISAHERALQGPEEERCSTESIDGDRGHLLSRSLRGSGGFLDPHPSEALTRLSHKPVRLRNQLSQAQMQLRLDMEGIEQRLQREISRILNSCSH